MKFDRHKVYAKYTGHCAYCGEEIKYKDMQVDHIIPQVDFVRHVTNRTYVPDFLKHLTVDDVNHIDNLNPACRGCNKWKSFHHLELFRSEIEMQVKRLNTYSANYRMAKRFGLIEENEKKVIFYFEWHEKD